MSKRSVELHRIAAQLGVEAQELDYLDCCDGLRLNRLRAAIAMATMDRHRSLFERLARASALLPAGVAARVAQDILGAELVACLTPFMPPARSADLAKRMPVEFQADVSTHMVAEYCGELLSALGDDVRVAVTRELLNRQEFAVMGTLVDYLPLDVVGKLAGEIRDPHALLQITCFVERKSRLKQVVEGFDDLTMTRMLEYAAMNGQMEVLVDLNQQLPQLDQDRLRRLRSEMPTSVDLVWQAAEAALGIGLDRDAA